MDTITALPSSLFLFRGLTPQQLERAESYFSAPVCYEKGKTLYSTHQFQKALGVVLSGTVSVRSPQEQGHSVLLNCLGTGDIFGAAAWFEEGTSDYVTDLTALTNVCVRYIRQEQMVSLFAEFPLTAQNYIAFLSGRIRFLNRKLAALTGGSSVSRLYHYCLTHGNSDGTILFPASMTDLARTLNMGRSSLYRSLDTLLAEGIVAKNGKEYILIK